MAHSDKSLSTDIPREHVVQLLRKQIAIAELLKRDLVDNEADQGKVAAADLMKGWIKTQLDLATNATVQLLLQPSDSSDPLENRMRGLPLERVFELRACLMYPSHRAFLDWVYPGSLSRPDVMDFMSGVLGIHLEDLPEEESSR